MELKSLIVGIFISVALFAVKSGVGIHYVLVSEPKINRLRKALFIMISIFLYSALFGAGFLIIRDSNMAAWYDRAVLILKSGMLIHVVIAAMMFIWGMILLKNNKKTIKKSNAWLIMVIPCPLCGFVILFTMGTIMAVFPDSAFFAVFHLFAGFMAIKLATIGGMGIFDRRFNIKPDFVLGWLMLAIAAYFILSVTVIPQFSGMDKIYRIARSHPLVQNTANINQLFILLIILSCSVAAGFNAFNSKRKFTKWILGLF